MPAPLLGLAPFDPGAVLALLQAFYPVVSPAALAQALAAHPDTFGYGVITRPNGDKIQLPDGRIYDCIVNSGGRPGTTFWSCSYVDPTDPGGPDDPFALEDGPLAYLDENLQVFSGSGRSNVDVVAEQLAPLAGADGVLDGAGQAIVTFDGAAQVDGAYNALVAPAREVHAGVVDTFDQADPSSVIDATNSHDGEIDSARGDYVEDPPPPTDEPDPGAPPKDGGDGGDDGPPAV